VLLDREVAGLKTAAVLSNHGEGVRAAALHLLDLWPSAKSDLSAAISTCGPRAARADALLQVAREHRGLRVYVEDQSFTAGHGEAARGCCSRLPTRRRL